MKKLVCIITIVFMLGISVVPAYAADTTSGDGHFSIGVGEGGIVINPGAYPDLGGDLDSDLRTEISKTVVDKAKSIAQTITAICSLVCFTVLLVNITRLAQKAADSNGRQKALSGILWSGISLTLFGGSFVVVTFFWNFLV